MTVHKNILLSALGMVILLGGGVAGFLFFEDTIEKNSPASDPITALFGEDMQEKNSSGMKADFFGQQTSVEKPLSSEWVEIDGTYYYFGSYDPSLQDITPVEAYNGPIPSTVQSCLAETNFGPSAELGFVYATLDNIGFTKLLNDKTTNPRFKDELLTEWSPVLGYAMENNQLHWDWVPESRQYIFYPHKGDEEFWYCYFRDESETFQNMFQSGKFTNEGQGENTLYYLSSTETNPYSEIEEESWATLVNFSDEILNESFKDYMIRKPLGGGDGTDPLRVDVQNNGVTKIAYGVAPHNTIEAVYQHKDTGFCFLSHREFKNEFYTPISRCEDTQTGDVYTVEIVPNETDTDGDGIVDRIDTDDDNDWYLDTEETSENPATDPLDSASTPAATIDTDGDGQMDSVDTDDDNDGYTDLEELQADPKTNPRDKDIHPGISCGGFGYSKFDECNFS